MPFTAQFISGKPIPTDHTPTVDVVAGQVIVIGDTVRIAPLDIAANTLGTLHIGGGIYQVPKSTAGGSAIVSGKRVYWDAANGVATVNAASGANKPLGITLAATVDASASVTLLHWPN
jgi:predicted RecA/RadA family phage recombinase